MDNIRILLEDLKYSLDKGDASFNYIKAKVDETLQYVLKKLEEK